MPRTSATATATPTAAETKLWNASWVIWEKYDIVVSPAYDCQFVFVVNDAAVSNACRSTTAARCCGFRGSRCWSLSPAYVKSIETPLNSSMEAAYRVQCWSSVGSTPASRYSTRSTGRSHVNDPS